jgi:hypothetical protein
VDGTGSHHVKQNKPDSEDKYCIFSCVEFRPKNDMNAKGRLFWRTEVGSKKKR